MYCYAVIAADFESDQTYPVCVALSNSRMVEDITTLLLNVHRGFRLATGKKMEPPVAVTDYSWALIHGVFWTFRISDLSTYLHGICNNNTHGISFIETGAHRETLNSESSSCSAVLT